MEEIKIPDERLEKLADFYSSEFVEKNEPWIREIPFYEWLNRQITSTWGVA